ncbi:hypothetical protein [Comamonas thiooxydans]|uniref:hypothetical protein n=1 Tax=Comamonas thiooxydans TaxID=363952 RepID=UPI0012E91CD3|nr:hypothetical protein [Comamonas thiooxydans]
MPKQMKFGYPRRNLKGEFVTFRLGQKAGRDYLVGDFVDLIDSRTGKVLLHAKVVATDCGELQDMASKWAHMAHNWLDHPAMQRAQLLVTSMKKRYFPGRCQDNSHTTVIHLIEHERTTTDQRGTH